MTSQGTAPDPTVVRADEPVPGSSSPIEVWQIDEWRRANLIHGFLGAGINFRTAGDTWSDLSAALRCRLMISCDALEAPPVLFLLNQVHGTGVVEWDRKQAVMPRPEGDAWVAAPPRGSSSSRPDTALLGILTADCLPVLFWCRKSGVVGAAHCGWRSAVGGIAVRVIDAMLALGAVSSEIEMASGIGIGPCCFEVGDEVAREFDESLCRFAPKGDVDGAVVTIRRNSRFYCDLRPLIEAHAHGAGIERSRMHGVPGCSFCDRRFFSYRREKDLAGRQLTFIAVPAR